MQGHMQQIIIYGLSNNQQNFKDMIKTLNYFMGFISVLLLNSCMTTNKYYSSQANRDLLQEYFLCCCLVHGFDNLRLDTCDISPSIYFDIARYDPMAFHLIDSIAKNYVDHIDPSVIEDHHGKKSIIARSIYLYKSKSIKKIIKSMDIYMTK